MLAPSLQEAKESYLVIGHTRGQYNAYDHMFGSLAQMGDNGMVWRTALDYGGERIIGTRPMSRRKANQIIVLPVSDATAERFAWIVAGLYRLDGKGRLPFYFSLNHEVRPEEELAGQKPINLRGQEEEPGGDFVDYQAHFRVIAGHYIYDGLIERPENLRRARGNCISVFNLVARSAGVDMEAVAENLSYLRKEESFAQMMRTIYDEAEPVSKGREGIDIAVRRIRRSSGHEALIVRSPEPRIEDVQTLFKEAMTYPFPKSFDTEPDPLPDYIQREFDGIHHTV